MKADGDHAIGGNIDQFKIAAVGLDGRADEIDHILHAVVKTELVCFRMSAGRHKITSLVALAA
jgi:hypothetical protein